MSDRVVEAWKTPKGVLRIMYDDASGIDPRKDWDTLGTIYHWHRRYDLGTRIERSDSLPKGGVKLAVYMMDHSGVALSTKPFGDPWDSGMVGYIHATEEAVRKAFEVPAGKRVLPNVWKRAKDVLRAEIETYSAFLSGEVYGFTLTPDKAPVPVVDEALIARVRQRLAAPSSVTGVVMDGPDVQALLDFAVGSLEPEPEADSCWGFIGPLSKIRVEIFDAADVDSTRCVPMESSTR